MPLLPCNSRYTIGLQNGAVAQWKKSASVLRRASGVRFSPAPSASLMSSMEAYGALLDRRLHRRGPRPRGGDWLRDDLADAQHRGVTCIVSCLTSQEETELGLNGESDEARSLGLEFLQVPITDQGTPRPGVVEDAVSRIGGLAASRGRIAIHCRQGLGRSPLVAAAVLVRTGITASGAWEAIARARGRPVPETEQQRQWLARFAAGLGEV